ncbi:hypothetical protein HK100_006289 [Physocladia obscura]|uniref:C2HC/C3H-type domain-containing protein n=1 Tax=Physocladia obscura TaxID=109957 RepID=A0AAD5T5A2_9FUNG|nr:hypothetical protein HK100_006289 [Physocladia obscura]
MALHQHKCLRKQLSSASLSLSETNLHTSSPPKPQFQSTRATGVFGGGFKATITKRSLSDIPTNLQSKSSISSSANSLTDTHLLQSAQTQQSRFQKIDNFSNGPFAQQQVQQPKQTLKRIPSLNNRVPVAAESYPISSSPIKTKQPIKMTVTDGFIDYARPVGTPPINSSKSPIANHKLSSKESGNTWLEQEFPQDIENDPDIAVEIERIPCPICQRKFAGEDRLEKHIEACSKIKKQRKVFDATKHRVKGTELEQYALKKIISDPIGSKKNEDAGGSKNKLLLKKQNWRVKHDSFIRMVRSNKTPHDGTAVGPTEPDPDYVQCEHCGRRFNETAAERHIPICANTKHRPRGAAARGGGSIGAAVAEDEARMRKRLDFKPPIPKTKKGSPESKSPERRK